MQFDNDGLPIIYNTYDESSKRNKPQPVIIPASTAKIRTENKLEEIREKEIIHIFDKIYEAIDDGDYDIVIDGVIFDENAKKLQELGYKIEEELWIAAKMTRISWEGEEENGLQ